MDQLNFIDVSQEGFIWIASFEGLIRYDGVEFQSLTHHYYPELRGGAYDLCVDERNTLWAFDTNYRYLFRIKEGVVDHWDTGHLTNVVDYTLFRDWQNEIIFLGGDRFYKIVNNEIEELTIDGLDGLSVHHALFADDGSLWIADMKQDLHQILNGQVTTFDPLSIGAKSRRVIVLEQGNDNSVWAVTAQNDLLHYSDGEWNLYQDQQLSQSGPTRDLLSEANGTLWIGTRNGMFRYEQGKIRKLPKIIYQDEDNIYSIVRTPEGSIAYSTFNNGLKLLQKKVFKTYVRQDRFTYGVVRSITANTSQDGYLVGSTEGVSQINATTGRINIAYPELNGVDITDIKIVTENHIFFSTYGQGLYEYLDGKIQQYTQADGLPSDTIYQLELMPDGRLAMGTYNGLAFFDGETFQGISTEDGLPSNIVLSLFLDQDTLWLSMASAGIYAYRDGQIDAVSKGSRIESATVFHLTKDSDGVLWGGFSGGIFRIDDGELTVHRFTGHFPSVNIFHVWHDNEDSLWLTTNSGLYSLPLSNFNQGTMETLTYRAYFKTDGLPSNNITALSAAYVENGKFWIPFSGGIAKIDPELLKTDHYAPTVHIDRIRANGSYLPTYDIHSGTPTKFEPGLRYMRISYTAPLFQGGEDIVFRYRLKGFEDWQETSEREASYTNLPPGDYIFEVSCVAGEDSPDQEYIAYFSFTIAPYFHQTVWFYLLAACGFLLIGYLINYLRLRASRRQHERLEALVDVRTRELQHQSEELLMAKEHAESANRLKSEFTANISHEIRTPMNSIIGFTDILRSEIKDPIHKDYLNTVYKSGTTLLTMINDLLDLSKIEANKLRLHPRPHNLAQECRETLQMFSPKLQQKNLAFNYYADPEIPDLLIFDPIRFRQVLLNIVGNAIKFTDLGGVDVNLKLVKRSDSNAHIQCSIRDTGDGIPEHMKDRIFLAFEQASRDFTRDETGSGLGLAISQRLVKMMNGNIEVESKLGEGSTFTIDLPSMAIYGEAHKVECAETSFSESHASLNDAAMISAEWLSELFNGSVLNETDRADLINTIEEKLIPALTKMDIEQLVAVIYIVQTLNRSYQLVGLDTLCHLIREYSERIDIGKSRRLRDLLRNALDDMAPIS